MRRNRGRRMDHLKISELIKPTDRQRECLAALRQFSYVLYGGAMGGGKSYLLRWWCVLQCVYYFARYGVRNVRVGLFSKDYPTLVDRQISKIKYEFPSWLGRISRTQDEGFNFKLADRFGGGIVAFRNLDDPSKYNSAEFASIGVEELTENLEQVFHELRKRLRWPGIPTKDLRFLGCTNPGGVGHGWVKRYWIDEDLPEELKGIADRFAYIKAKAQDNPHLDEDYRKMNLDTLPEEMRRAYAEGDWDLFVGQYFTEFRKDVHVVEPFEIPWFWKIRRGGDWGEANPCAYLWRAVSPDGDEYIIGEVYGAGLKVKEQAERIKAFEAGKHIDKVGVLDGACFDPTGRDKSIADQFAEYGVLWAKSVKSGDRGRIAHGAQALRSKLGFERSADGKVLKLPRTRIFSTCFNLIRTLPTLVHDPSNPENYKGEDHAVDAWRYLEVGPADAPAIPASEMSEEQAAFLAQADKRFNELRGAA
jgi:phage terminase large subunit